MGNIIPQLPPLYTRYTLHIYKFHPLQAKENREYKDHTLAAEPVNREFSCSPYVPAYFFEPHYISKIYIENMPIPDFWYAGSGVVL